MLYTAMKASYICPYVHCIKQRRSLQGHPGSSISRDGAFGEVMWKGEAKRQAPGGTQKNMADRTPMALGSGAAPSAMHTPARCTPSPAVRRRLRPARQAAEEGAAILRE